MTLTHKQAIILHGLIGNSPCHLLTELYDELTTYLNHFNIDGMETGALFEDTNYYVTFDINYNVLNRLLEKTQV